MFSVYPVVLTFSLCGGQLHAAFLFQHTLEEKTHQHSRTNDNRSTEAPLTGLGALRRPMPLSQQTDQQLWSLHDQCTDRCRLHRIGRRCRTTTTIIIIIRGHTRGGCTDRWGIRFWYATVAESCGHQRIHSVPCWSARAAIGDSRKIHQKVCNETGVGAVDGLHRSIHCIPAEKEWWYESCGDDSRVGLQGNGWLSRFR